MTYGKIMVNMYHRLWLSIYQWALTSRIFLTNIVWIWLIHVLDIIVNWFDLLYYIV